ncbi:MAG: hypothetical protein ABEJ90_02025 [Halobacterium sp.]
MSDYGFDAWRAVRYVVAAAVLATVVGALRQESLAGGLLFGVAIGVGVAVGLLAFELASRFRAE